MSDTANYIEPFIVPAGEGGLITSGNMTSLELLIPGCVGERADQPVPPTLLFLTACMIRAQSDDSFVQEQLDWMNAAKGLA